MESFITQVIRLTKLMSLMLTKIVNSHRYAQTMIYQEGQEKEMFFLQHFIFWPRLNPNHNTRNPVFEKESLTIFKEKYLPERCEVEFIRTVRNRIDNGKNLIVEKSANMNSTLCVILLYLWYFLFIKNTNFLIIVPKRKDVYACSLIENNQIDLRDIDEFKKLPIMNLILYIFKNLPKGIKPVFGVELREERKDGQYYAYLINHDYENTIIVTSCIKGADIDEIIEEVVDNYYLPLTSVFLDDFAFNSCDDEIWKLLDGYTDSIIMASCPNGKKNLFYELKERNAADIYTFHWMLSERTSHSWYEGIQRIYTKEYIEQYYNMNYDVKTRFKTHAERNKWLQTLKRPPLTPEEKSLRKEKREEKKAALAAKTKERSVIKNISCLTKEERPRFKSIKIDKVSDIKDIKYKLISGQTKSVNLPVANDDSDKAMITSLLKLDRLLAIKRRKFFSDFEAAIDIITIYYGKEETLTKVNLRSKLLHYSGTAKKCEMILNRPISEAVFAEALSELETILNTEESEYLRSVEENKEALIAYEEDKKYDRKALYRTSTYKRSFFDINNDELAGNDPIERARIRQPTVQELLKRIDEIHQMIQDDIRKYS